MKKAYEKGRRIEKRVRPGCDAPTTDLVTLEKVKVLHYRGEAKKS